MRLSVILLCCSAAGVLGGGALIGVWALGVCLIFCSLCLGVWALGRDDGMAGQPQEEELIRPGAWLVDRVRRPA